MTLTKTAPARRKAGAEPLGPLGRPVVLAGAVVVLLVLFGWQFLQDPTVTVPGRDPAWYTWRAGLIADSDPGKIADDWGPFSMFSGGYRVTVPLMGALLEGTAGTDRYTFGAFLVIGAPILAGLAMAAFAYRHRRDPLLYLLTLLASVGLFLTTPYVGYLDNITVLALLAMLLAFLGPARSSWGARSAVFLFGFVAALTHPTTCVLFGMVLLAAFALRLLTGRFSLARALKSDGPALFATGFGMLVGLSLWVLGIWGPGGVGLLKDAALPPPYTKAFFLDRLWEWVVSLRPLITFPLIAIAVGSVVLSARRMKQRADTYSVVSIMYLLPLLGVFGFLAGLVYPYYRFMNATTAVMLLAGLGAYVAIGYITRLGGPRRAVGILGTLVIVGGLVYVFATGWTAWLKQDQMVDQPTRAALSAVRALAVAEGPAVPIVFVNDFRDDMVAYGWSKTYLNVERTGIPGDIVDRTFGYFGLAEQLREGQPTAKTNDTYNKVADGFWDYLFPSDDPETEIDESEGGLYAFEQPPVAVVIRQFNLKGTDNLDLFAGGSLPDGYVQVAPDVLAITGAGFTTPSQEAVDAAAAASERQTAAVASHPGLFGNPLHTLRVFLVLAVILVAPGLIASRWFQIEDFPSKLALVPGVSIAMILSAAILVIAVTRDPFTATDGWISVGLATAGALGLDGLARRRDAGRGRLGPALNRFLNGMFSVFSNPNFSNLMAVQYLAQMADGIVQGSLAKAIAFQGQAGFDLTTAPSARYLVLVVVLLYVPYTFVSPFMGVLIDRMDRRSLLVWSNVFRAALVGVVALIGFDNVPDGVLVVAILVTLACTRILLAIKSAGLPVILEGRDLLQGNGMSQAGGAMLQVVGAGLATVGTVLAPAGLVALGGAAVYLIAGLLAKRVEHLAAEPHVTRLADEIRRVLRDISDGLREVARRPAAALGLSGFQSLRMEVFGFVALVAALQAREILGGGSGKGAVYIGGGTGVLGAALGLVLAQRLKNKVPPAILLSAAMAFTGLGVVAFGGVVSVVAFGALFFIIALGFFLGKIAVDTIYQRSLPDNFRGRGFSLFDIAYNLGWVVPAVILFLVLGDSQKLDQGQVRLISLASGVVFLVVTAGIAGWARNIGLTRRESA